MKRIDAPGRDERGRAGRGRDERGAAITLWVVLMVPVAAFAAVAAMAGPQRLAAQSSVQEAADDLAALAVAWRDGQGTPGGPVWALPPGCSAGPPDGFEAACEFMLDALARDLGQLGVDMGSLRGFYSDSLVAPQSWPSQVCFVADEVTGEPALDAEQREPEACETGGGTWEPLLPCRTSGGPSGGTVVYDAVHVALAADWNGAGWAPAQVWPDGLRMGAESIGRLTVPDSTDPRTHPCEPWLVVLDAYGLPVWAGEDAHPPSRRLSQGVRRVALAQ